MSYTRIRNALLGYVACSAGLGSLKSMADRNANSYSFHRSVYDHLPMTDKIEVNWKMSCFSGIKASLYALFPISYPVLKIAEAAGLKNTFDKSNADFYTDLLKEKEESIKFVR